MKLISDSNFENKSNLEFAEYEACTFTKCDLSNKDLTSYTFIDCSFSECDLSNSTILDTNFQDVVFKSCKLIGLNFDACKPFLLSFNFYDSNVSFSSFQKLKLTKTKFINCKMQECDFFETNLTSSIIENCDLGGVVFENTNLQKCDFRESINLYIDIERNNIKKAKFNLLQAGGLLSKWDIKLYN